MAETIAVAVAVGISAILGAMAAAVRKIKSVTTPCGVVACTPAEKKRLKRLSRAATRLASHDSRLTEEELTDALAGILECRRKPPAPPPTLTPAMVRAHQTTVLNLSNSFCARML